MAKQRKRTTNIDVQGVQVESADGAYCVVVLQNYAERKDLRGRLSVCQIGYLARALHRHLDTVQNSVNSARKALRNEQ